MNQIRNDSLCLISYQFIPVHVCPRNLTESTCFFYISATDTFDSEPLIAKLSNVVHFELISQLEVAWPVVNFRFCLGAERVLILWWTPKKCENLSGNCPTHSNMKPSERTVLSKSQSIFIVCSPNRLLEHHCLWPTFWRKCLLQKNVKASSNLLKLEGTNQD